MARPHGAGPAHCEQGDRGGGHLRRPKGVILDLDGTLRRGRQPIPGAVRAVGMLIGAGIRVCYLTNNSTRSRPDTLKGLTSMGFPEAPVVTSSYAASLLLMERTGPTRCLVIGEQGLFDELKASGHGPVMAGTAAKGPFGAVVAGLDRSFDNRKLAEALDALKGGALFVVTNEDPTLPVEGGMVLPGAGTVTAALRRASSMEPLVAGKPEPFSTRISVRELNFLPQEVLVIGDRGDMDAIAGLRAGCMTALVRTGDREAPPHPGVPIFDDVLSLVEELVR